MENPFKNILTGAVAAGALAACSPAEEAPKDPFADAVEVSVEDGTRTETVTVPPDEISEEEQAIISEQERINQMTNNGQYTLEEVEQILSGQTQEVDSMTREQIEQLETPGQ